MRKSYLLTLIFLSATSSLLYSQSGQRDTSFGPENLNIVNTDIAGSFDLLEGLAIQSDQKIVAVGTGSEFGKSLMAVIRYLDDGSYDPDFGENGIAKITFPEGSSRGHELKIQPDGKIIIFGQVSMGNIENFAIARLNTDGTPDDSFGENGRVISGLGSNYEFANTGVVLPNGKIIAAGRIASKTFSDFAMVQYLPDGEIDHDFGNNGLVVTSFRDEDEANDIAIQPDGKIILAGFSAVLAKGDFALARYLPDGTLDETFGEAGKVMTDLAGFGESDFINSIVLEADGKITAGGNANFQNLFLESDLGMVRYNSDGQPDSTFGTNGIFIFDLGSNSQILSIAREADGKYLVAGKSDYVFGHNQWMLARMLPDGGIDTSFADFGIAVTDLNGTQQQISDIAIQNDSRIVVGGFDGGITNSNFAVSRYYADFIIDFHKTNELVCYDVNDGAFVVNVSGAKPPYSYSIDSINFQASPVFQGLGSGDYYVTIKDSNPSPVTTVIGPIHFNSPEMPQPTIVEVIGSTINITYQDPGAEVMYSVNGGITFQSSGIFPNLPNGIWHVVVLSPNGCILYSDEVMVNATGVENVSEIKAILSPNPSTKMMSLKYDSGTGPIYIDVMDYTGRLLNDIQVTPSGQNEKSIDVSHLVNGYYILRLQNDVKIKLIPFVKGS